MPDTRSGSPSISAADDDELHRRSLEMSDAIRKAPADVPSVWRDIRKDSSLVVKTTIEHRFGPSVRWATRGENVRRGSRSFERLAAVYSRLPVIHRRLLIENAAPTLIAIGSNAENRQLLADLAAAAKRLVLVGTSQQMFIADLAVRLGIGENLPSELKELLIEPFVDALTLVLEHGAPAACDAAIEGLGALLKHRQGAAAFELPRLTPAQSQEGQPKINATYDERRRRQELVVSAIGGDAQRRTDYYAALDKSLGRDYTARAELLRALPALWRQAPQETQDVRREEAIAHLTGAAGIAGPDLDRAPDLRAEFSRYQESVFQTIDVMLEREADGQAFDDVTAAAVDRIAETVFGTLELCNAQVRATVAVLCTAARIAARLTNSKSDEALEKRYKKLDKQRTEWTNPGIVEGCFRGLPLLLWNREHNVWTEDALRALLDDLRGTSPPSDFVALHARVCANAALRNLLVALNERMFEQLLEPREKTADVPQVRDVQRSMAALLEHPEPKAILRVFQKDAGFEAADGTAAGVSPIVVGAMAMESELLSRMPQLFADWGHLTDARRLLLVRIFAQQFHAASYERDRLAQYPALNRMLRRLIAVSKSERERDDALWRHLSHLGSQVAAAAGPDLQDFVGGRSGHVRRSQTDPNDLPGYVLTMISNDVSAHLAADIARQIDLNRARVRQEHPNFDFAIPLYQMTLRDPNVAIFDHLLGRIVGPEEHARRDRALLLLFRRHVELVRSDQHIDALAEHAKTLAPRLDHRYESRTLRELGRAMELYAGLATRDPRVWDALVRAAPDRRDDPKGGGLGALFQNLDDLAQQTYVAHRELKPETAEPDCTNAPEESDGRRSLYKLCSVDCALLRQEIEHYLRLAVGHFDDCSRALNAAIEAVRRIGKTIEHDAGLEPPERIILVALIGRLEQMLEHTLGWFVNTPRRWVHGRKPELFWRHFTNDPFMPTDPPPGSIAKYAEDIMTVGVISADIPKYDKPPAPVGQDLAFEKFYVEWTSAELDIDHLQWALQKRWRWWFKSAYSIVTRLLLSVPALAFPFVLAVVLHNAGYEEIEGIGFLLYLLAFGGLCIRAMLERRASVDERPAFPYRFQALLPRLFRLIVVPLALIVDFEHSYIFPMHASNLTLSLLLIVAWVGPVFFIRREVRNAEGELSRYDEAENPAEVRRRVRQILSIALVHSFIGALLFSFLFESNYVARVRVADVVHSGSAKALQPELMPPHETSNSHYHHERFFLHIIPRETRCNLAWPFGDSLSDAWKARLRFEFYPTLILAWTALGLFFGVFLEGFLRGERIRVEMSP